MRLAPAVSVLTSLLLHGACALVLLAAARAPLSLVHAQPPGDEWAEHSVEVDGVASPDTASVRDPASTPAADPGGPSEAPPSPRQTAATRSAGSPSPNGVEVEAAPHQIGKAPRRPRPRPSADPYGASGSALSPGSSPSTRATSGVFTSTELAPGVFSLPSAFTRAIPPATAGDPLWQTLDAGRQQAFVILIRVDAQGHIEDSKILGNHRAEETPAQFRHLRERVVALLGAGAFALQGAVVAGSAAFRVTVTLSDRRGTDDNEPAQLVERGFSPPNRETPGRAYFTLASGRHFEARVEVINTR